jgi:hypothetical protein
MDLRTQVAADLPTFLNVGEFGQTVLVDGDPVTCVLPNDEDLHEPLDGVSVLESTMYARASDFDTVPAVRQRLALRIDDEDRQADVIRVDNDQGMLAIRLRWWNS